MRLSALILATVSLVLAAPATAHDGLAPTGSPHTWLPAEEWVDGHWIPFDEQALKEALGLRGRDLEAYLYNDHHTLADLARRRGMAPEQLADRLVAPWGVAADPARLAQLRDRTIRILTQGHLAQHVFFHVFHGVWEKSVAPSVFGVSDDAYWRLRLLARTPLDIARRGGVPPTAVRERMIALLRAQRDAGIALGAAWAPESDRILARQLRALPCWLRRPIASRDRANPYGKAKRQHGEHARGWPGTPAQRRRNERRVERVRRSLRRSCWRPPPAWRRP
jgi:hypothetical protein